MDETTRAGAIEYVVIGAYFVFMLVTGFLFRRLNNRFVDYFRSGNQASWWLVGVSVFMASFTAWTFTGAVGVAYKAGITVAIIFLANTIGYLVNWALTAKWFRQMRATTFPEVAAARFNVTTQQFYVFLGLIPGLLTAALTLWGVALFASSVFGFDLVTLIVVLGVIVLVYSTTGGVWAVMATDFLQALILIPMTILVAYLSLQSIGGYGEMLKEIDAAGLSNMTKLIDTTGATQYDWYFAMAMIFFVIVTYSSMSASVKFFACKTGHDARKAAGLAALLTLGGTVLWFIPPIVARLQFADLVQSVPISKPEEAAYAVISMRLLPNGLTGLIVVAMFSATMSSLSTNLNWVAAIITQDVYTPLRRREISDREMFLVGQISSLIIGIAIVSITVYMSQKEGKGLFDYMLLFGSLFGTPMIVPMFLALFVRKTPAWAAIVSVCCGLVFSILAPKLQFSYAATVFSIAGAATAGYLATMLFYKNSSPEYKERVRRFYEKMETPVDFEKEVGVSNDAGQLRRIGLMGLLLGLFMLLLLFVPNPLSGRLNILCLAGSIALFGGLMLYAARRNDQKAAAKARELGIETTAR